MNIFGNGNLYITQLEMNLAYCHPIYYNSLFSFLVSGKD